MLLTEKVWNTIRDQFTEDEKIVIRMHINGETICPPGWVLDEPGPMGLPPELHAKIDAAKEAARAGR
jgi:hypothetical protein